MKPVNLVPQEQRRRTPSEGSGRGAYALVGLLVVLLGMAVAYVLTANTVTERKNETEAARAEADRLEAQAVQKDNFADFAQIAQTRVQSVAGVAASRFDWERLMRELSRVMPAGTWLQSASASVAGAEQAPTGGTPEAAGTGSPTANLVGCTPEHSDVARMMVHLRQLHRVTDVVLNQSAKEDEGGQAGLDGCGAHANFDLTLSFSPITPVVEAPRGASRVPASLGGGS